MNHFEQIIERDSTFATKSYTMHHVLNHPNAIGMWVADMDFACPKELQEAFEKRIQNPIFGYTITDDGAYDALIGWYKRRHNDELKKETIVLNTGVLPAYGAAIRVLSEVSDELFVPRPAYGPFVSKAELNKRKIVSVDLKEDGMFDESEAEKILTDKTKIFVLCNPHNPTGKVYSKEELKRISDFCEKHSLKIISDEIHCDITFGVDFVSICNVSEYARNNTVRLISYGKTFNLAGLKMGAAIIYNEEIRTKFVSECDATGIASINIFAIEAFKTVYSQGDKWLDECLEVLRDNQMTAIKMLNEALPEVKVICGEGTYFLWLDLSKLNQVESWQDYLLNEHEVYVNAGTFFGDNYKEYIRLNMALPKSLMIEGVNRIIEGLKSQRK